MLGDASLNTLDYCIGGMHLCAVCRDKPIVQLVSAVVTKSSVSKTKQKPSVCPFCVLILELFSCTVCVYCRLKLALNNELV